MNELKKKRVKVNVNCECGITIFGNSQSNAEANLKLHHKSKLHKKQMLGKN